jgi:hypothetical protein
LGDGTEYTHENRVVRCTPAARGAEPPSSFLFLFSFLQLLLVGPELQRGYGWKHKSASARMGSAAAALVFSHACICWLPCLLATIFLVNREGLVDAK